MEALEKVNGTLKEINVYVPQPHFLTRAWLYISHQHYKNLPFYSVIASTKPISANGSRLYK